MKPNAVESNDMGSNLLEGNNGPSSERMTEPYVSKFKLFASGLILASIAISGCSNGGGDKGSSGNSNANSSRESSSLSSLVESSVSSIGVSSSSSLQSSSVGQSTSSSSESSQSSESSSQSSSSSSLALTVTEGLVLRLDAQAIELDDGSQVTAWNSIAPATTAATQSGGEWAPTLVADALNGNAVVRFDGVNDKLRLSSNVFATSSIPLTVFVVATHGDYSGVVIGSGADGSWQLTSAGYALGYAAGKPFIKSRSSYDDGVWLMAPHQVLDPSWSVLGARVSATGSRLLTSCHDLQSTETPTPLEAVNTFIGGSENSTEAFMGDIAEILVYNRALSDQEFTDVRSYLSERYALPIGAITDADEDSIVDACDNDETYLAAPEIDVTLESPESLFDDIDPALMIDLTSTTAFDPHTRQTHVYNTDGDIAARFDLNGLYNLRMLHFWNFDEEAYDVDTITLDFYGANDVFIEQQEHAVEKGFEDILAQDIVIDVNGVSYIRAVFHGDSGKSEMMNIGFSGTPAQ